MESLPAATELTELEESEVSKIVGSLKNNKAADIFGITSEHLKLASIGLIPILTHPINGVLGSGIIPDDLKIG